MLRTRGINSCVNRFQLRRKGTRKFLLISLSIRYHPLAISQQSTRWNLSGHASCMALSMILLTVNVPVHSPVWLQTISGYPNEGEGSRLEIERKTKRLQSDECGWNGMKDVCLVRTQCDLSWHFEYPKRTHELPVVRCFLFSQVSLLANTDLWSVN
jgi:hypothetical protein